ncbi:hypothetical protein [Streptomyces sp. NPDC050560]|uniref:hypothetical protein n=1 Tax=Streptomyces sp. NPDC050560 TaxID=3365630 RepID=UPI003796B276
MGISKKEKRDRKIADSWVYGELKDQLMNSAIARDSLRERHQQAMRFYVRNQDNEGRLNSRWSYHEQAVEAARNTEAEKSQEYRGRWEQARGSVHIGADEKMAGYRANALTESLRTFNERRNQTLSECPSLPQLPVPAYEPGIPPAHQGMTVTPYSTLSQMAALRLPEYPGGNARGEEAHSSAQGPAAHHRRRATQSGRSR